MQTIIPNPKGIFKFRTYSNYNDIKSVYFTNKIIDKNAVPGTIACLTFPPGGGVVVATDATLDELQADVNLWNSICFALSMSDKLNIEYNIEHCIRVSGNSQVWRNYEKTGVKGKGLKDEILKNLIEDYFILGISGAALANKYNINIAAVYKYLRDYKKEVLETTGVMLERS
jgi:hypothetical protein